MQQPLIHIVSPQDNAFPSEEAHLMLMVGNHYLGFGIFQPAHMAVHALVLYPKEYVPAADWSEEVNEMMGLHPQLIQNFQKVYIVIDRPETVLIPGDYAREEIRDALVEMMFGKTCDEVYIKDLLLNGNMVNHYAVPTTLGMALNAKFPKSEWWHLHSLWLNAPQQQQDGITASFLFQQLHLTVYINGALQMLQQYHYTTTDEALYWLLRVMEQLQLNTAQTPVLVEGMIDRNSALAEKLYQYIPTLQWNETIKYKFSDEAVPYPLTMMAYMDKLFACVS